MKKIILVSLYLIAVNFIQIYSQSYPGTIYSPVQFTSMFSNCNSNPYVEVFRDDFNIRKLNTQFWAFNYPYKNHSEFITYNKYPDNYIFTDSTLQLHQKTDGFHGEAVEWLPDNMILEDGKQNKRWFPFTGATIYSKYQFRQGVFEANIKIPNMIQGNFPAFWLYSDSAQRWNELDIFEFFGECQLSNCYLGECERLNAYWDNDKSNKTPNFTLHREEEPTWERVSSGSKKEFSTDLHLNFNKYGVIWEKQTIQGYVNSHFPTEFTHYWLTNTPLMYSNPGCNIHPYTTYYMNRAYPVRHMNLIINTAVTNPKPAQGCNQNPYDSFKYPDTNSTEPNILEIDYVRILQRVPRCSGTFVYNSKSSLGIETSNIDFPGDDNNWEGEYNLITGTNLTLSSISLDSTEQIDLRATGFIKLLPGFHSKKSFFRAKGEYWSCPVNLKSSNEQEVQVILLNENESYNYFERYDNTLDKLSLTQDSENSYLIYPNPTNGLLNISAKNANYLNVSIIDITGKHIYTKSTIENYLIIDISNLNPGIYTASIQSDLGLYQKKIIKSN